VSPQGEWVDLDIDRTSPRGQGAKWNSGFQVKARIDSARRLWYGEMRIPFAAIESRPVRPGLELRAGFFRISGVEPQRGYLSWHTTDGRTFHVPERFGILRLGPDQ
jgi:hypothetical protein